MSSQIKVSFTISLILSLIFVGSILTRYLHLTRFNYFDFIQTNKNHCIVTKENPLQRMTYVPDMSDIIARLTKKPVYNTKADVLDRIKLIRRFPAKQLSLNFSQPNKTLNSTFLIPNIVHYVNFGQNEMSFLTYLSFMGVSKFLKPDFIFLHGDVFLNTSSYWKKTKNEIPNIFHVKVLNRSMPNNNEAAFIEHLTDVTRIRTLIEFGGIYLDSDILIFKSMDSLRRRSCTMGRESPNSINSGVIICEPGSTFLRLWLESYRSYDPDSWAYNAVIVPHKLHDVLPHLLSVESTTLVTPGWPERDKLYTYKGYDWKDNFSVHVWKQDEEYGKTIPTSPGAELDSYNTTLGEMMRYIFYF